MSASPSDQEPKGPQPEGAAEENVLIAQRRRKLEALRAAGENPFPNRFRTTHRVGEIVAAYGPLAGEALAPAKEGRFAVAGRLMGKRLQGKVVFMDLRDGSGRIQLFLRQNDLGEAAFARAKELDIGDIVGAEGGVFRTKTGELSVWVRGFSLLAKNLRPLPEKWHGLQNVETRYRQRYVDLIANPEVAEIFRTRTRLVQLIRRFLDERGFLEVETPMMQSIPGGAAARPFITHHNTLDMDLYLRVAPELFLKRLLVGGIDRVFELNRNFRNEGISVRHNPEFTMLEFYQAYADYNDLMELTEEMFRELAQGLLGRGLESAVAMALIQRDDAVEELLQVLEIDDLLMRQAVGEPAGQHTVVGFDLAACGSVARLATDTVRSEPGKTHAERHGVEDRGPIGVQPPRQAPAHRRGAKDPHGRGEVHGRDDERGEHGTCGIVEDAQHVKGYELARAEHDAHGSLGVALPDLVRRSGDEARAAPAVCGGAAQALIARMRRQAPLQRGARDGQGRKRRAQHLDQQGEAQPGIFGEQA